MLKRSIGFFSSALTIKSAKPELRKTNENTKEAFPLNLITCAEDCVFQQEGYCTLACGAPVSLSHPPSGCFHYQPRPQSCSPDTNPDLDDPG